MSSQSLRPATRRSIPRLVVLALAGVAGLWATPTAHAQQVSMSISAPRGAFGMSRPAMTQRELDGYAGILGLDEAQREAAKELLASYTTEFEKASREQAEKMRRISEEFRETRDDEVWQQMGPISEKYSKHAAELEKSLLNDIKTLCDEKQLAQWPRMERTRRRDRTIDRGTVSGESVDLVRIVAGLELPADARTALASQLEAYEQDLDRVLEARNKIIDQQAASFTPGRGPMTFDMEKFQKQMADAREAGEKVREVNQRYARSIEGLLPESSQAAFSMQVKRASFPMVYRASRTERAFDAALKFNDLDAKQREAIASLRQGYEQDTASLNDKWAAAILDEEKDGAGGIALGGGGVMLMSFGDEDSDKPSAQARKARRDADKKAMQSLESLLTDEQKTRLPQPGDDAPAGGMMMERSVVAPAR
jgi:hypothetical protein